MIDFFYITFFYNIVGFAYILLSFNLLMIFIIYNNISFIYVKYKYNFLKKKKKVIK